MTQPLILLFQRQLHTLMQLALTLTGETVGVFQSCSNLQEAERSICNLDKNIFKTVLFIYINIPSLQIDYS